MKHEPKRSFRDAVKISLPRGLTEPARAKFMAALDAHQAAIDALLAFLDEADGDADTEEADAPEEDSEDCCSAWDDYGGDPRPSWAHPGDDPYGDEKEHSLGWTGGMDQERALKQFSGTIDTNSDLEADDSNREPSLGSTTMGDQTRWAEGGRQDLEEECEDEGAQCEDEGSTQWPHPEFSPACPTLAERQE